MDKPMILSNGVKIKQPPIPKKPLRIPVLNPNNTSINHVKIEVGLNIIGNLLNIHYESMSITKYSLN